MNDARREPWDVRGKTVLVTGGSSGIGRATAIGLVRRGADVVLTSRDDARGEAAVRAVRAAAEGSAAVRYRTLDLASLASIERFARHLLAEVPALHVVVHNAGIVVPQRSETAEGFELTFGTNHLGMFRLQQLLEPRLIESAPARVVVVASSAHHRARTGLDFEDLQARRGYDAVQVYSASKLANVLFARQLARRLAGSGVTANALHPGVVATGFNADGGTGGVWGFAFKWLRPLLLSPERGARTSVHVACEPELSAVSGAYFSSCRQKAPSRAARDDAAALQLWKGSEELIAAGRAH